ncbi:serine hydrolase domain-containing protein [Rhodococcus sp. MEB041]|uniref:serine hydrolase domain-containing protein n=1 Tax=Rhodococcus sp. MEB041 TaxID=3040323 RepID=UPI00254DCC76|nr:serine hydrolase domain-containing protein [Rhodococcus sp. MEB041]
MFPPTASGTHDERFAPVVAEFEEQLTSFPYGGASLAIFVDGAPVVDVWGGMADAMTGRPWRRDTLAVPFSCSKSVTTIVVLTLVEQGILELDTPLAHYWPEFADSGKLNITIREVLSHRAGLPLVDAALSFADVCDGGPLAVALERQKPLWEPGTGHGYHALTVGALIGEVVRRATGETLGTILREHLCALLDLDLWIGLPPVHHSRVATVLPPSPADYIPALHDPVLDYLRADDRVLQALTLGGAVRIPVVGLITETDWNDPQLWAAELPAGNAMATARSLAKLHAALVSETAALSGTPIPPILSPSTLRDSRECASDGAPVIGPDSGPFHRWGTGFMLSSDARPMLSEKSFGHDGAAGGLCFADDDHRVGFAFLPSVMGAGPDTRADRIVDQLRTCITR